MAVEFEYQTPDRHFAFTPLTVTKRTLWPNELQRDIRGQLYIPWKDWKYLENEQAALRYIAEHTAIPVPKVITYEIQNGTHYLTMERKNGIPLDEVDDRDKLEALQKTRDFLNTTVLPELQRLTSKRLGGLTGHVLPPERVRSRIPNQSCSSRICPSASYVFCHGDLAQHNILVDPSSLEVTAIIDWENSGFFPPICEEPLWLRTAAERQRSPSEADYDVDRMIAFLCDPLCPEWNQ
jgi:Phosphotransferase enzyme family